MFPWQTLHAGHFHHTPKGKVKWSHLDIDYDEHNIHPQCEGCNGKFGGGKPREYARHLVEDYGPAILKLLDEKNLNRRELTNDELKQIIQKYGSQ